MEAIDLKQFKCYTRKPFTSCDRWEYRRLTSPTFVASKMLRKVLTEWHIMKTRTMPIRRAAMVESRRWAFPCVMALWWAWAWSFFQHFYSKHGGYHSRPFTAVMKTAKFFSHRFLRALWINQMIMKCHGKKEPSSKVLRSHR